jgi:hypothetical protein
MRFQIALLPFAASLAGLALAVPRPFDGSPLLVRESVLSLCLRY